jgi:uncharacterized protein GlcG (DUF336 family)
MQEVTLKAAMAGIETALAHARRRSLSPLAVAVLDAGGHVLASVREDGSGHSGIDIAVAKGRGALSFRMPSRAVGDFLAGNALVGATLCAALGGAMLPIPGAVLIKDATGRPIGAIAAAGDAPDNDEAAALAGLAAIDAGGATAASPEAH